MGKIAGQRREAEDICAPGGFIRNYNLNFLTRRGWHRWISTKLNNMGKGNKDDKITWCFEIGSTSARIRLNFLDRTTTILHIWHFSYLRISGEPINDFCCRFAKYFLYDLKYRYCLRPPFNFRQFRICASYRLSQLDLSFSTYKPR